MNIHIFFCSMIIIFLEETIGLYIFHEIYNTIKDCMHRIFIV